MIAIAKPPVYVLRITLDGSRPTVSRTVKVQSDISLAVLHDVIQKAMGWFNCHLHQYIFGKQYYGVPSPDNDDFGFEILDEKKFTLRDLAPKKGSKLKYEYDSGDSWIHLLKVEQVILDDPEFKHPVCLGGENACPPEDVGGVWGYESMLKALNDPKHPEYKEFLEWVGGKFDPYAFDLNKVNIALKRIKG